MKNTIDVLNFANIILENKINIDSIVDIGSGNGKSVIILAKKIGVDLDNIHCFEKNPKLIKEIEKKKVNAYNFLISDKNAKVKLEKKKDDDDKPLKKKTKKVFEKRYDTLSRELKLPLIECIVISMSNNAHKVLNGIGNLLKSLKAIKIALETKEYNKAKKLLKQYGFVVYKVSTTDKNLYDTIFINKK